MKELSILVLTFGLAACKAHDSSGVARQKTGGSMEPSSGAATGLYRMCGGQLPVDAPVAALARSGDSESQLAPMFLDKMESCRTADALPPIDLALQGPGTVNEKGDCVWAATTVSCHYHLGVEFLRSDEASRPKRGELHCIFPARDAATPMSPQVFGGQFVCSKDSGPVAGHQAEHHGEHKIEQGQACGRNLLTTLRATLSASQDVLCCDDGTLTGTLESRSKGKALAVRPDFRLSAAPMELDCRMLATMTGHSANAPKYGAPVETDFAMR